MKENVEAWIYQTSPELTIRCALLAEGGLAAIPVEVGKLPGPEGPQTACPSLQFASAMPRALLAMPQIVVPLLSDKPEHWPEFTIFWQLPVPS